MKLRNLMAMGAAVLLVGAVGCGGDGKGDGAGGAGGSDGTGSGKTGLVVCDLFTTASLEATLGGPLKPPERLADSVCNWDPVDFETGRSVSISLHRGDARNFDQSVEHLAETFDTTVEEISGVGERAYQYHYEVDMGVAKSGASQVGATKGNDMVAVTVGGINLGADEGIEKAKALVIQLLEKI